MKPDRGRAPATASVGAIAFTAALLLSTLVLLATTLSLPAATAIVPRVVGWPLALLLGYVLVREIRSLGRQRDGGEDEPKASAEIGAILWLLALPALATVLGFLVGPALYVVGWARFRAGERVGVAVAAGAVAAGAILVLFSWLLGVQLPQGVLGYLR
jgi:hypothetical protein